MATHLLNITPSSSIQNKPPYTLLYNKPTTYKHLRVFGCLCYPNVPAPHKLSPRSTACVFLGYPSHHRGFRCLDLTSRKIIISRHVVFNESIFPFDTLDISPPPSYHFLDEDSEPNPISRTLLQSPNPHPTPPPSSSTPRSDFPPPSDPASSSNSHLGQTPPPGHTSPGLGSPTFEATTPVGASPTTATAPSTHNIHPMLTRGRAGITKPIHRLNLHTTSESPVPKSHTQALLDPNWTIAMQDEFNALITNRTWVLVPRPQQANIVRSMWLFRKKYKADGTLERYKARLVANGRSQRPGIDCDETFAR